MPKDVSTRAYQANKDYYDAIQKVPVTDKANIKASMLVLSACADDQSAYEGGFHGIFTGRVIDVWSNGYFEGNYYKFFGEVAYLMVTRDQQIPTWTAYGPNTIQYKRPFAL